MIGKRLDLIIINQDIMHTFTNFKNAWNGTAILQVKNGSQFCTKLQYLTI